MKIHLTAKAVWDKDGNESKIPDGGCSFDSLPKSGNQRIKVKDIKGVFAAHTTVHPGGDNPRIVFHTNDGDVAFLIKHMPGRYCLTCDERLPDAGAAGSEAEAKLAAKCRKHVKSHGDSAEKSVRWPDGYMAYPTSYDCMIEETDLTKRLMAGGS